jgi:hypothetical protein
MSKGATTIDHLKAGPHRTREQFWPYFWQRFS